MAAGKTTGRTTGKKPANSVAIQRKNNARHGKAKPRGKPFPKNNAAGFKSNPQNINRNGRPKSHDELRALIQELAAEQMESGTTRITEMLLGMFASAQPADRSNILEHGWGKVPQAHKIGGDRDNPILIKTDDIQQAEAELNEWRKKMTEQLSGLNVVPTPDTSSTPTA
jgi:cytosine/adenosine deaminase-related metal-dependent hydrolase